MRCIDRTPGASPRAVFDTNVLLDFWVFDDAVARPLLARLECGAIEAVTSQECLDEFADVLSRDPLGVTPEIRKAILRRWDGLATRIDPIEPAPLSCRDPGDQKFLDLADSAGAGWLCTRDNALLRLASGARKFGLRIVRPAELSATDLGAS